VDGRRLLKEVRAGRRAPVITDFCNKIGQKRTHAVQQKDHYSITSSARPDRVSGTVMPSALAVFIVIWVA